MQVKEVIQYLPPDGIFQAGDICKDMETGEIGELSIGERPGDAFRLNDKRLFTKGGRDYFLPHLRLRLSLLHRPGKKKVRWQNIILEYTSGVSELVIDTVEHDSEQIAEKMGNMPWPLDKTFLRSVKITTVEDSWTAPGFDLKAWRKKQC